jgi:hypothetical protein
MTTAATNYWTATASATTAAACFVPRPRHTPGVKLSFEERKQKSVQHKFGLCFDCDAGLDDRADFIVGKNATYTRLLCNDCSAYYAEACTALRVQRFLSKLNERGGGEPCECDGEAEKGDY